jgi:hypothetical protein
MKSNAWKFHKGCIRSVSGSEGFCTRILFSRMNALSPQAAQLIQSLIHNMEPE